MLKPNEREKLQDCLLLIQSLRNMLAGIRREVVPNIGDIENCFSEADSTITQLLRN
jgi:hypothetical protein